MLSVQCKECNTVIVSTTKIQCCGCPNMMKVTNDSISAVDLSKVLLLNHERRISIFITPIVSEKEDVSVKMNPVLFENLQCY